MSPGPALLLFAPSALRHDAVPVLATSCRILDEPSGSADGLPSTVIVPAASATAESGIPCLVTDQASGTVLAPLFFLLPSAPGTWVPYTLMSCTGDDFLYVALPGPAVCGDPASPQQRATWTADLAARHRVHGGQLSNHRCWFRNLLPGLEAEHKFTLSPATDIWPLAILTHQLVGAGSLPDWICEHGNNGGFEQWDFITHLYEITQPAAERGDIAFIPAIGGQSWIIRRKRYQRDQVIRRQDLIDGVVLGPDPDLPQVIRDRFGLRPAWGATYRRVRYNVMLESLATGHVFSIMYDRCTTKGPAIPPLVQAEVEYIRSRTIRDTATCNEVMDNLELLTAWTRAFLAREAVTAVEDHQSKLTWLRTRISSGL